MKKLIIICFILMPLLSFSQFFINASYKDVVKEFIKDKKEFKEDIVNDIKVIKLIEKEDIFAFLFSDENICYTSVIYPATNKSVYGWIEYFNKEYVVLDNYKWQFFSGKKIIDISLHYKDDYYLFIIK